MSGLQDYARRFLARRAADRPAQATVAGPGAGQAGGGGMRRTLALPAPGGKAPGEVPSVQVLDAMLEHFDELLRRLEAEAHRDGLHDDGPMTHVLELLQLCMATLRELTNLNIRTTERHADQVVGAIRDAERQAKAATDRVYADLAQQMATRQDQFADGIATRVVSRTERDIERRAGQFPLMAAFWLAIVLVGSNGLTGCVVHDRTASEIAVAAAATGDAAIKATLAAIHETETGLREAFATESLDDGIHWLDLMNWNRIAPAMAQCAKEPGLSIVGTDGRRGCKMPFWTEAPVPVRPPSPPAPLQLQPEPRLRIKPLRFE